MNPRSVLHRALPPALALSASLATPALARGGGTPCLPQWQPTLGQPAGFPDANIEALEAFDDGTGSRLYAGGIDLVLSSWDGSSWSPLPGNDTFIKDLLTWDDGSGDRLYACGNFSSSNVSVWDGTSWSTLGTGMNNGIESLASFDDGSGSGERLYAAGRFTTADGQAVNRVGMWNGTTWVDLAGGVNNNAFALAVFDDGSGAALYCGGRFATAGGVSASRIARWDGTAWSSVGGGFNNTVEALEVFDGELYAGGIFINSAGQPRSRIARWDGTSWNDVGGGLDGSVNEMLAFDDGTGPALYVAGEFFHAGGTPASRFAKWDGATWTALGAGTGRPGQSLTVYDDGEGEALYAGGEFYFAGDLPVGSVARWKDSQWSSTGGTGLVDATTFTGEGIADMLPFDDGSGPRLAISGRFVPADGLLFEGVVAWDGTTFATLGDGLNGPPLELFLNDDGLTQELWAFGGFSASGATPVNFVARWDGTAWSDAGSGAAGIPRDPVRFDDGSGEALFAYTDDGLVKWDGALWNDVPGTEPNGAGFGAIEVYDDGSGAKLYAAGNFDEIDETPLSGFPDGSSIACWDGTTWSLVGNGLVGPVFVNYMEVVDVFGQPELVVAGSFDGSGPFGSGLSSPRIIRWNGTSWGTMPGLGSDFNMTRNFLKVDDDLGQDTLYAFGSFATSNGAAADSIARWDGTSWGPVPFSIDPANSIDALANYEDDDGPMLYVGGSFFDQVGGDDRYFARWGCQTSGTFCDASDGSLAACPCANPGAPESGCDIQQGTGGVQLGLVAREQGALNRVTWNGTGFPAGSSPTAIVIRAGELDPATPVVFGDGLRCIGSTVVRMSTTLSLGGTSEHTIGHGVAAGDYYYQLWYRDPSNAFCTKDEFNMSSGLTLGW